MIAFMVVEKRSREPDLGSADSTSDSAAVDRGEKKTKKREVQGLKNKEPKEKRKPLRSLST
jgi:hypothetical protein